MTCVMQICILLKRALTKMWVSLVQKWYKNSYKNTVGLLSLQFDSVSVYVVSPSKWEVGTLIYRKKDKKIHDHLSQVVCVHTARGT